MAVGVKQSGYFRKWVRCLKCGFHYSIYSRPTELIHAIYGAAYRDKNSAWRTEPPEETFRKVIALPPGQSETKYRVAWLKERISEIWKAGRIKERSFPHNFLDIGGGSGIFAYEFQDAVWRGHIIDPSADKNFICDKLNMPLVRDFYRPRAFPVTFALISAIYVLEHTVDPLAFLQSVREELTRDSFLFIEVPNTENFKHKHADDDIFHSCHLWMFEEQSLACLLERAGCVVHRYERLQTLRGHYAIMALAGLKNE